MGAAEALRFEILGPLRVFRAGDELNLGPGKQRAVLAVLLANANQPVSLTRIIDAVWRDDPPANGANVVQKYVGGLRQILEPDRAPRSPGHVLGRSEAGYLLRVEPGCLDIELFTDRIRRAQDSFARGDLTEAGTQIRDAVSLWRGEPAAGMPGPWFDVLRHRLGETYAAALEIRAEIELESGKHAELLPELVRLVAEYPLRERLRYLLILALYRCGRQAEALTAYREARSFLIDEFGVEPGEQLGDLHEKVLRSDPSLAAPVLVPEAGLQPTGPASEPVPAPEPVPVRPASRRWRWVRVAAVLIPLLSFGMLSWLFPAYLAGRKRDLRLAAATLGYLVLMLVDAAALNEWETSVVADVTVGVTWSLLWWGGALHGLLLTSRPPPPPAEPMPGPERRRVRAERAGLILVPLVSLGMLSWVALAYSAVRRRNGWLGLASLGYLGVAVTALTLNDVGQTSKLEDNLAGLCFLLCWIGGTFHGTLLAYTRRDAAPSP